MPLCVLQMQISPRQPLPRMKVKEYFVYLENLVAMVTKCNYERKLIEEFVIA